MKNNITLIAFLLFLSGQMAIAQKTLSPEVLPYTKTWPTSLIPSLQRAGFELPGMKPTPQNARVIRARNAMRLDSTKTFNAYNTATGDSTPVFKTRFLYPFSDSKLESNFQFEDGIWKRISRSLYVTDDQERVVEILAEVYDEEQQEFYFDSRLEVHPRGNSNELVDSFFTYAYDTIVQDWTLLLANHNTFDAQDKLQESATTLFYLGDPIIFKEIYSYDANGDNHLIEETGTFDGMELPTGKTEMSYYEHKVIEAVSFATDGVSFFPQHRLNTAYHLSGKVRKQMSFDWDVAINNFRLYETVDYYYDNQERVSGLETTKIAPNQWDVKDRVSFAYVEGTDLYLETVHNWDHDAFEWILDSRKYHYYDGSTSVDPTPNTVQPLSVSPNPGTGVFRLNLTAEANVKVFDSTGKMLTSSVLQPGHDLDITMLPPGLYTLTALQGTSIFNGKIVKQ